MANEYLDRVVHQLTHRRFKNTSRESVYQQGSSVANSFYDPRNIGNYDAGEVNPSGTYATHYPVNTASNTMGFSIMDDQGDDRRQYYPSTISSNVNALVKQPKLSGAGNTSGSSGSASDYMYFNKFYEALLDPASHDTMENIAQSNFIPVSYQETRGGVHGMGTNAPSSASAVDYAMNNPYAFKSNFSGGGLGAASSGSASDYFDSNPYRVPAMQSQNVDFTDFMEGGKINWSKYLGHLKSGVKTIVKHAAPLIKEHGVKVLKEHVVPYIEKHAKTPGIVKKYIKHVPTALEKLQEVRSSMKKDKEEEKGKGHKRMKQRGMKVKRT